VVVVIASKQESKKASKQLGLENLG